MQVYALAGITNCKTLCFFVSSFSKVKVLSNRFLYADIFDGILLILTEFKFSCPRIFIDQLLNIHIFIESYRELFLWFPNQNVPFVSTF